MALIHKNRKEIPIDAIILTENEALQYQTKIINGWEKQTEVWPLQHGPGILALFSAAGGVFINHHYRRKLRLGVYGRFSTYLPIVILPTIMTSLFHQTIIQPRILLEKDKCPLCLQTKASLIQTVFGVGLPLLLAPLSSFMFATRHFTYRIPSITSEPKEVFKLWSKFTSPISFKLFCLVAINFFAATYITYKEIESFYNIQMKLHQLEKKLENGSY